MAKEIEWTLTSLQDRFKIYFYWIDHNKSDIYSKKLEILFNEAGKIISEFPEIGTETDHPNLRVKVVKNYKLFYLNQIDKVQIIRVWDSRQNTVNLKLLTI